MCAPSRVSSGRAVQASTRTRLHLLRPRKAEEKALKRLRLVESRTAAFELAAREAVVHPRNLQSG